MNVENHAVASKGHFGPQVAQGSPDELCMQYSHIKPVDGIFHDRHRISAAVYMQDQRFALAGLLVCENMCNPDVFACIFRHLSYAFSYTYQ